MQQLTHDDFRYMKELIDRYEALFIFRQNMGDHLTKAKREDVHQQLDTTKQTLFQQWERL